jgi:hypothetical protein
LRFKGFAGDADRIARLAMNRIVRDSAVLPAANLRGAPHNRSHHTSD